MVDGDATHSRIRTPGHLSAAEREQLVELDGYAHPVWQHSVWKQLGRGGERCVRGLYNALKYVHNPAKRFDNLVYAYGQLGYLKSVFQGLLSKSKFISNSPEFNPE